MKRDLALSFALLLGFVLGSIPLAAQSAGQQQTKATTRVSPAINACPVSIRAQHAADGDMLAVDRSRPSRPKGIAQRLLLTLSHPDSRQITKARVTIRGFTAKSRVMQTMTTQDDSDAAKTMDVNFSAGSGKVASADLWVPGMSAVRTIDLDSVTYADGSTWKLSADNVCRAFVDGIMLITSR